jgi:hypothetical protein
MYSLRACTHARTRTHTHAHASAALLAGPAGSQRSKTVNFDRSNLGEKLVKLRGCRLAAVVEVLGAQLLHPRQPNGRRRVAVPPQVLPPPCT